MQQVCIASPDDDQPMESEGFDNGCDAPEDNILAGSLNESINQLNINKVKNQLRDYSNMTEGEREKLRNDEVCRLTLQAEQ